MALQALLFILVFFIGLVYALFASPIYGLYVYILNFFLDAPGRWWGGYLPDLRWSFIAAIATLAAIFIQKAQPDRANPFKFTVFRLYVLYVVWMWIQIPWALDPLEHERGLNFMTKFILVFYMLTVLADSLETIERILLAMVAGCFYLGYLAFSSYGGGRLDGIGGPGIDDSSSLGLVMAAFAIVAGVLFHISSGKRKWFAALAVAFVLNAVVTASSRASFLGLAMGGACLFWFRPRNETGRMLLYGVLAATLFLYLASDYFWERMETLRGAVDETSEMDRSAESRMIVIKAQWEIFKAHPFGTGHQGTTVLSYSYIPIEYHASQGGRASHNTVMTVLVDQGIVGIVLWIAMIAAVYRMAWRNHRILWRVHDSRGTWINAALISATTVILVSGLFSQQLKLEVYYWLISLIMALTHWVDRTYGSTDKRVISSRGTAARQRVYPP